MGNIIRVEEDEFAPADMLLLNSSGPKGSCYVETKSLDGETNLKVKQTHKDILKNLQNEACIIGIDGEIECE